MRSHLNASNREERGGGAKGIIDSPSSTRLAASHGQMRSAVDPSNALRKRDDFVTANVVLNCIMRGSPGLKLVAREEDEADYTYACNLQYSGQLPMSDA